MLGVGESIAFPGSSKIIARHVPAEQRGMANAAVAAGIALGPAVGTLAGGLIVASWGWRAMFFVFGLATLLWLVPWRQTVARAADYRPSRRGRDGPDRARCSANGRLWSMSIGHCARQLLLLFPARLAAAVPGPSRAASRSREMTLLATLGYAVQAVCALELRPFLGLVDAFGPIGGRCAAAG